MRAVIDSALQKLEKAGQDLRSVTLEIDPVSMMAALKSQGHFRGRTKQTFRPASEHYRGTDYFCERYASILTAAGGVKSSID